MREPGWYWVKYYNGGPWEAVKFGHNGLWLIPGHFEQDGYFKIIGPKIEEPKDE